MNAADGMSSVAVPSDRPGERLAISTSSRLPGIEFWTVEDSMRHWTMRHETFTACLVRRPRRLLARWRSRGVTRETTAGAVQLMEPGEVHRTTAVSEPASFFVVWWRPEVLESAAQELGFRKPLHFRSSQLEHGLVEQYFERLVHAVGRGDWAASESALAECTTALVQLASEERNGRKFPSPTHPAVRRALEYLHDHYRESVSLAELARHARISKFHLAHCFREAVGMPPHQYQKLLRLQTARQLLERGKAVQDVAETAGFADAAHLSRAFKQWLGVVPSSMRRSLRTA